MNQQIGSLTQFAGALSQREFGARRLLVIRQIGDAHPRVSHPKAKGRPNVGHEAATNLHIADRKVVITDFVKYHSRGKVVERHRKHRRLDFFEEQFANAAAIGLLGCINFERGIAAQERLEKWQAKGVVVVQVGKQTHGSKRTSVAALLTEITQTGTKIKHHGHLTRRTKRYTRGVATKVMGVGPVTRGGATHTVERNADHGLC